MAASCSYEDVMEVAIEDVCLDMEVDLPSQASMVMELHACRNTMKITMPTTSQREFLGLPVQSSRVNYSDFLYLVLDTNVLLSHLKFLKELKSQSLKGIGKPVLIVPWVVVQELDALKNGQRKVADQAVKAGKFINECLSTKHPRVRGQTVEEVNTEVQNLSIMNNDDRILHCCLVYKHKIHAKSQSGVVMLFSNDTMLCAKAKMNNVLACDRNNLLSELKRLSQTFNMTPAPVSYTHTTEYEGKVNRQLAEDERSSLVDDCLCQAENYVRDALSVCIHHEMSKVYGELCNDIMARKPPWSLEDVMFMLDRHWVAVFRYVFTTGGSMANHEKLKVLLAHVNHRTSMTPEPSHVVLFIANCLFFLEQLRNNTEVWSRISVLVASLKVLSEKVDKPHPSPPATTNYAYPMPDTTSTTVNTIMTPTSPTTLNNAHQVRPFLPHLSQSLYQVMAQCPPLPLPQLQWIFQVVRESLVCAIISAQTSVANMSLSRPSEIWLFELLRLLEGLVMAVENVMNDQNGEMFIPLLRILYDAMLLYLSHILDIQCPLNFSQLCDVCQVEGAIVLFQDGLRVMLDARLQLLELLHSTAAQSAAAAQNHVLAAQ